MAVEQRPAGRLGTIDRGLYALFSRHAESGTHDRNRQRYRAAGLETSFDVFIARLYGAAWFGAISVSLLTLLATILLPASTVGRVFGFFGRGVPILNELPLPAVSRFPLGLTGAVTAGVLVRWLVIRAGGRYLDRLAAVRRDEIERTLPGAVRYMRVLASGSNDSSKILQRVAEQDAYGATADSLRDALNRATLTGSLDEGLSLVARDTPSRDTFSPFLLKFREHAAQGRDSLESYLEMEGRLLSHKQERAHERASGYLELIAELFVVMLVFPALAVLILTVAGVLSPGLSEPVSTPFGSITLRALLFYASIVFVLLVGAGGAWAVAAIRPTDRATPTYSRPEAVTSVLATATSNPASAAVVFAVPALAAVGVLFALGYTLANVLLLGYAAYGIPVGAVSIRRAGLDDAKDREIQDFVHAVSGHVSLGRPFPDAVQRVSRDVDLGPLQPDVEALAFNLSLTTGTDQSDDVRAAALDRFVERVGTPLASQTVGLVVGALEAGSDTEHVFETLETEIGRLYHERKTIRSRLLVYAAIGWTTALLVVGIIAAVNLTVLDSFSQLSSVSGTTSGMAFDPQAVDPARDKHRFYLIAQATVLACGWFAGVASRGTYEALGHSGVLVALTYLFFTGLGVA
ncbi:type II secretion system F family protein [Halobacteriaceae archaeon SHR40]|uniref:type II secretion system F family protein n=1 Tax=Halovenus amylolytica TaxID=2500550 RepID=UPI000FE33616